NPLYILFIDDGFGISGTISNFGLNRSAELAFPVLYESSEDNGGSKVFNLDAHYRHFLGGRQRGFYLSGFARYQYADYRTFQIFGEGERRTLSRSGIGFGIGSRIFSASGFYWGWSFSMGRFLAGRQPADDELPNVPSLWLDD